MLQCVKTVLFVCGNQPWKKTLFMPLCSQLTKDDLNAMCGEPLPPLPQGHFESLVATESCQVFIFKHDRVSGCGSTGSPQHSKLPPPLVNHKSWEAITEEPNVHVGFHYMFGHDQPYFVAQGKVRIEEYVTPQVSFGESEMSCTSEIIINLRMQVGEAIKVELLEWECSHYSPFKGGGDIKLSKIGQSTVGTIVLPNPGLMSQPGSSATSQPDYGSPPPLSRTDITPLKQGEHRVGNVENKVTSCRSENDVRLQLQANMMLAVSTSLKDLIINFGEKAGEEITIVTCYGICLGGTYPLKILKLTVDFENQICKYEEQLSLGQCAAYAAYIDIGISYILKRL